MKRITIDGDVYIRGWTTCAMCDKRMRYTLRPEVAFFQIDQDELCWGCLLMEFHVRDSDLEGLPFKILIKVLP